MTRRYPDLDSASDWLRQISHAAEWSRAARDIFFNQLEVLLRSAYIVTRHQYGISALVSQTSFRAETSGGIAKCRLFSQAKRLTTLIGLLS